LDELDLDGEGDTTDKIVTFKFNTCLGACPQAPVMSINHRMYGKVSAKQAQSHVSSLRKNSKGAS
jgi:NADH:ubiquinone oxidoreductase subunit E